MGGLLHLVQWGGDWAGLQPTQAPPRWPNVTAHPSKASLPTSYYSMWHYNWYQFVWNDDVRRLTKQPKLTTIIQSCQLTLFGHVMRMDDNADAKRILLASPPADWRRQPGHPRITWLSTIQQDLKQHHLTLPEAADLAQNRPLWKMMSTYGATQSWVACQKWRRRL